MLFWGTIPNYYVVRLPQKLNSEMLSLYYIHKYDHCEESEGSFCINTTAAGKVNFAFCLGNDWTGWLCYQSIKKRKGKNGLVLCKKLRITTSSSSNKNKTEISIGEFFLICAEAIGILFTGILHTLIFQSPLNLGCEATSVTAFLMRNWDISFSKISYVQVGFIRKSSFCKSLKLSRRNSFIVLETTAFQKNNIHF